VLFCLGIGFGPFFFFFFFFWFLSVVSLGSGLSVGQVLVLVDDGL
jgi:hypothetical protein